MEYEQRMKAAIASLESQEAPNYSEAARQLNLDCTAIKNQLLSKTTSQAEANSRCRQLLTNAQEEQLITQINKLTVHYMPPTSQIVKNIAAEIKGGEVNKNQTANFIQRHSTRLKSLYLRNINNQRAKAKYALMFKHFFELVMFLLYLCLQFYNSLANI